MKRVSLQLTRPLSQAQLGSLPHCPLPHPPLGAAAPRLGQRKGSILQRRRVRDRPRTFFDSSKHRTDQPNNCPRSSLLPTPIHQVLIPHTHALPPLESATSTIPINLLLPSTATPETPAPLVLILTGLDGYRTELAVWQPGFAAKGVATAVVEIPGTGDSPAAARDPTAPDRQWSSVLDWVAAQPQIDGTRVIVWGFSTGGYYALRMAHTHAGRLLGAVSLGGGADRMFEERWLGQVDRLEYPFDLRGALAEKFGYGDDVDGFAREARGRFSLVADGTLEKRCCKVLLVNGEGDEIFPIEDLWVALEYGMPKAARVIKGTKHMGEPESFVVVLRWIYDLLGLQGDVMDQLATLPTRVKY